MRNLKPCFQRLLHVSALINLESGQERRELDNQGRALLGSDGCRRQADLGRGLSVRIDQGDPVWYGSCVGHQPVA